MKIIDFARKGNVVRFYLGEDDLEDWYGDDWDDAPYDCNAGAVYDRFVAGWTDKVFPFDCMVLEPCVGNINCHYCKDDMKARRVPCIIVVPPEAIDSWFEEYAHYIGGDKVGRYYFGDSMIPQHEGKPPEMR